jgi:TP53 regulating kinase-like protein
MQIARGAEAVITRDGDVLTKERIRKGYRIMEIDERLRKRRTAMEAKLLRAAGRAGVNTPKILEEDKFSLKMEYVDGKRVRDILNDGNCDRICEKIGESVGKLHSYDLIHGDLTTSNMIFRIEGRDIVIYFIDFGLGFISQRAEDRAVDLYLLHEALESTHFTVLEKAWKSVLKAYMEHYSGADKVIKALSKVEKRGRYKER